MHFRCDLAFVFYRKIASENQVEESYVVMLLTVIRLLENVKDVREDHNVVTVNLHHAVDLDRQQIIKSDGSHMLVQEDLSVVFTDFV